MARKHELNVPGIYTITCLSNGRVYVGQSRRIQERWVHHRWHLERGIHGNRHLQNAWKKYGSSDFVFEIAQDLSDVPDSALQNAMSEAEVQVLKQHANFFNLMEAGEPSLVASDETRALLSRQRREKWADPQYRERVRATQLQKAKDPEFQQRRGAAISAAVSSETHRATRSAISKGLWADEEFRAQRSAERAANWQDPAYRAQQSESRSKAWAVDGARERRVESLKASWADPIKRAERQAKMLAGKSPHTIKTVALRLLNERRPHPVSNAEIHAEMERIHQKPQNPDSPQVILGKMRREGLVARVPAGWILAPTEPADR